MIANLEIEQQIDQGFLSFWNNFFSWTLLNFKGNWNDDMYGLKCAKKSSKLSIKFLKRFKFKRTQATILQQACSWHI